MLLPLAGPAASMAQQGLNAGPSSELVMTPTGEVVGPIDLVTAINRFPLVEGPRPARDMVPGWTVPAKIVVNVDRPERTPWLQAAMPPGVTVVGVANNLENQKHWPDADAIVLVSGACGLEHGESDADMFKRAPKLKWIHSSSGGTDQCASATEIRTGKILLTNSQKVKNDGLSESAFGFIFALARNAEVAWGNAQGGAFGTVRPTRPAKSLHGATMIVVGLGGAGTEIARLAHEFGMTVIATRASSREGPPFVEYVGLAPELPNLIGRADIVVIAAPLTPDTRGLFNAEMFSKMKRGGMLVNFSRAEIVVPDDLAAALRDGRVGSAGLDWASEHPLPPSSPLWKSPNLMLTGSRETPRSTRSGGRQTSNPIAQRDEELRWVLVRENMRRYAAGEKLYSVFDPKRGY
ncbi:MAG: NAD(P)-dependent oxidoreductase [Vicinamibacterales bacterium]